MTLILKFFWQKSEECCFVVITFLVAGLLASHQSEQYAAFGVIGTYIYWIGRILIEAVFFVAALLLVEKYLKQLVSEWAGYALAVLLSLVPFTLAITMLDLIIGFPELGFNGDMTTAPDEKGRALGLEVIYLLDNHIFLCTLLLLPRLLLSDRPSDNHMMENNAKVTGSSELQGVVSQNEANQNTPLTFFDSLEPPLDGRICSMEAQEHYILVTTTEDSRMVLHRFSDAIRQTPTAMGMQVHRSHWVAHSAVQEVLVEGQNMKLRLADDKLVPVSRTFRAAVESRYSSEDAAV